MVRTEKFFVRNIVTQKFLGLHYVIANKSVLISQCLTLQVLQCLLCYVYIDQCYGTVYRDKRIHDPDERTRSRRGSYLSHQQVCVAIVTVTIDTVGCLVVSGPLCSSSLAGHQVGKSASVHFYCASKHAVRALTEGMRQELREMKSNIKVTVSKNDKKVGRCCSLSKELTVFEGSFCYKHTFMGAGQP